MQFDQRSSARKAQLVGILDRLCESLELTDAQFELAKKRYEGVGDWLAAAEGPSLRTLSIYLQGSTALRTTVKPIGRNEHDVDLVAFMPNVRHLSPVTVKQEIGDRLRKNGHYRPLLEEMPRCWRLDYANEFHMDITPSIPNPECDNGGELVPDKALSEWKASNPKGYKALFEQRAALRPRMRLSRSEALTVEGARAGVEAYPAATGFKGILRRTVQIEKRHRDIYFADLEPCLVPISIVLTTLASRSYEYCVNHFVYDSELDIVRDIIRHMPAFIEDRLIEGRRQWFVWNETTHSENFAEKWNNDPRRAEAFFTWHGRILADLDRLAVVEGLDNLAKGLTESFGRAPATAALDTLTAQLSGARTAGTLSVAPLIGLGVGSNIATPVRANTFFGVQ